MMLYNQKLIVLLLFQRKIKHYNIYCLLIFHKQMMILYWQLTKRFFTRSAV